MESIPLPVNAYIYIRMRGKSLIKSEAPSKAIYIQLIQSEERALWYPDLISAEKNGVGSEPEELRVRREVPAEAGAQLAGAEGDRAVQGTPPLQHPNPMPRSEPSCRVPWEEQQAPQEQESAAQDQRYIQQWQQQRRRERPWELPRQEGNLFCINSLCTLLVYDIIQFIFRSGTWKVQEALALITAVGCDAFNSSYFSCYFFAFSFFKKIALTVGSDDYWIRSNGQYNF